MTRDDGTLLVEYQDTGVGLPDGFDAWRAETLGLTLVTSLTRQIDGTLTVVPGPGAGFALRIPLPEQELETVA